MTTTESRETAGQHAWGIEPPPAPPGHPPATRDRRSGIVRRTVWIVAVILALAFGFLIGQDSGSSSGSAQRPLVTPAQISSAAASAQTPVDDRGFAKLENGVQHSHGFEQAMSVGDRRELSREMNISRETALQYPTLADAEKAGLHRAGPFSPGLGTHMISYANYGYGATATRLTDDQIRHPLAWIYDGTKPDSPVAGLFYSAAVANPEGFIGPNDVWHQHTNICITQGPSGIDTPLGADRDATVAQCKAVGGNLIKATGPLLHVWTVPGYEDSQGVFAHLNPAVTCTDGTYNTIDETKIGTRVTVCSDGSE
jgi:hypothetical protein